MFNERYGLNTAVLELRKNMTRRKSPRYKIGQTVAIAQSYDEVYALLRPEHADEVVYMRLKATYNHRKPAGCTNKMFVKADFMPHHIFITGRKLQRLQDITDEECMKEGIYELEDSCKTAKAYTFIGGGIHRTPREAYAELSDKLNGKGYWESNPHVWAYEFDLLD